MVPLPTRGMETRGPEATRGGHGPYLPPFVQEGERPKAKIFPRENLCRSIMVTAGEILFPLESNDFSLHPGARRLFTPMSDLGNREKNTPGEGGFRSEFNKNALVSH